jgi:hypothetical protein
MQIFLRGKNTYVVDVKKTDTILHIKNLIFEKEKIPPRFLILTAGTHCLEDNKTLADHSIGREDTIHYRVRAIVWPSDTSDLSENAPLLGQTSDQTDTDSTTNA